MLGRMVTVESDLGLITGICTRVNSLGQPVVVNVLGLSYIKNSWGVFEAAYDY